MKTVPRASHVLSRALVTVLLLRTGAWGLDVVLNAQGEFLDAYLIDGSALPRRVVFIDPDPPLPDDPSGPPARVGRHVNGKLCFFPRGFGHDGQFVIADDTYREACVDRSPPQARCSVTRRRSPHYVGTDPDGWGIFRRNGKWTKRTLHVPWDFTGPNPQGAIDPQGCLFDARGRFWGTDVGQDFVNPDGSLIVFFPGRRHRYDTYCFVDQALATPGMPVADAAGNIYIPEPAGGRVTKFSPPFPSSPADCDNPAHLVTTPPTKTVFLAAATSGLATLAGIARVPRSDHFYVGSVLIPPIINEYDAAGAFVRTIVPRDVPKNPLGIDVGTDGTVYYAELNLDPETFNPRCGSVSRVRFDADGQPQAPEQLAGNLLFPDGVTVADTRRFAVNFRKLPASPENDPARCGGE